MTRQSFPRAATYSNVLQAVDAEQLNQVVMQALARVAATKRCGDEPSRLAGQAAREQHVHVALDGKTRQSTLGHEQSDQKPMHQLGLYETKTGLLLKEQVTGEKQNELSIVSQFLTKLGVEGPIISADAFHTQCAFCASVTRWKGHFVLIAKGNQSTLREDVRLFFSDPPADCRDWRTARTGDFGHGRLEIRELVATTELNDFLGGQWVRGAGLSSHTHRSRRWQDAHRGGLWHHQSLPCSSLGPAASGVGAGPLGHRKPTPTFGAT
jgi:hypothetical protein